MELPLFTSIAYFVQVLIFIRTRIANKEMPTSLSFSTIVARHISCLYYCHFIFLIIVLSRHDALEHSFRSRWFFLVVLYLCSVHFLEIWAVFPSMDNTPLKQCDMGRDWCTTEHALIDVAVFFLIVPVTILLTGTPQHQACLWHKTEDSIFAWDNIVG